MSQPLLPSLHSPRALLALYPGKDGALFELALSALSFGVTTCGAELRWMSAVRASLWLQDVLSKAAPFLGRKMLFGAGKGCL